MQRNLRSNLEESLEAVVPGAVLRGTLTLPSGSGRVPAMVVAHGASFGLRRAPIYDELVDVLLGMGIAVLRYDRRGEGESTGSAESVTLEELADDLVACVRLLHEHPRVHADRVGVWGFSQGGWVVALAAAAEPSIAGLVAVSASGTGPAEQMEYAVETTAGVRVRRSRRRGCAVSSKDGLHVGRRAMRDTGGSSPVRFDQARTMVSDGLPG